MKKIKVLAAVLAVVMLAALVGCADNKASEEPELVGGWTDDQSAEISAEEQEVFDNAVAGTEYQDYTLVEVLGTQVVAGINYKFLCRSAAGDEATMTVYKDLSGNCSISQVE